MDGPLPEFIFQMFITVYASVTEFAFSALTLLVVWQEEHSVCKNWVVGWWRGYLSGARCRLVYGPADATVTQCLLLQQNPDLFDLSGTGPPRYGGQSRKKGH